MRSPTDASPSPSRVVTHGSGPRWFATPSSWWTRTTYSLPVSPERQTGTESAAPEPLQITSESATRRVGIIHRNRTIGADLRTELVHLISVGCRHRLRELLITHSARVCPNCAIYSSCRS